MLRILLERRDVEFNVNMRMRRVACVYGTCALCTSVYGGTVIGNTARILKSQKNEYIENLFDHNEEVTLPHILPLPEKMHPRAQCAFCFSSFPRMYALEFRRLRKTL